MIEKNYDDGKRHVHVLSYGGGTQSTALLLMALKGEINGVEPDYIIFSDTGWEPPHVYEWIEKVNSHIKEKYGKEIVIAKGRDLREDVLNASTGGDNPFVTIPAFVLRDDGKKGMARRLCTNNYKIRPVSRKIRELLGYEPRQRVKEMVHIWKGISTDEIQRVKPIADVWKTAEHPLIDVVDVDRAKCIAYVEREGLGTPPKSSRVGCPYNSDATWRQMKEDDMASFQDAVLVEKGMRENAEMDGDVFLHRSRKPLDQVDFGEDGKEDFDLFGEECEGMCGT